MKLIDSTTGQCFELGAGKTLVGRADGNTIRISNPSVSSHHCEITMHDRQVVVKDLNSTNGTFIDGVPVTEAVCNPGCRLRLGEVEFQLGEAERFQASHAIRPLGRPSTRRQLERPPYSADSVGIASHSTRAGISPNRDAQRIDGSERQRLIGLLIAVICGFLVIFLHLKLPIAGRIRKLLLLPMLGAVAGLFQLITGIHIFELLERMDEMPVLKRAAMILVFFICVMIVIVAYASLAV